MQSRYKKYQQIYTDGSKESSKVGCAVISDKEIVLCWIPSHIGIQGNEMVDKQAKTSLSLEPTFFKIPFSNIKPSINKYILEEWQTSWNNSIGNKLLDINQLLVNINQLFETLEKKKSF